MSESNVKKGTRYEKFVQQVYQALNSQSDLYGVKVQQNVSLEGRATAHQIDVYWEFSRAGIEYKVAVECKDYKAPIEAEKINAFVTVLNDLGNIKGVFVSRNGFQSGAIKVAKQYGVQLMEIHEPEPKDLNGITHKLIFKLTTAEITELQISINVDSEWFKNSKIEAPSEINYYTTQARVEIDNKIITLQELIRQLPRDIEGDSNKHVFRFPGGWYIDDDENKLKIKGISFVYKVEYHHGVFTHDLTSAIKAVVKNVITEETQLVRM